MITKRVTNKKLVAYFLMNGVKPIDMFIGDHDTIVFVYDSSQTNGLYTQYIANL